MARNISICLPKKGIVLGTIVICLVYPTAWFSLPEEHVAFLQQRNSSLPIACLLLPKCCCSWQLHILPHCHVTLPAGFCLLIACFVPLTTCCAPPNLLCESTVESTDSMFRSIDVRPCLQAKQNDAQELTSGQASTMARNEQVVDVLTGKRWPQSPCTS